MAASKLQALWNHPAGPKTIPDGGRNDNGGQFGDTTYTKIFAGGLAWETQRETTRRYFEQFGELQETVVITAKNTGKSKGYDFVTFKDPDATMRACQDPFLVIGGRFVHFWAPMFKWGISIANVADFTKPPEELSYPQQTVVACTGIIWARYSTQIIPKNWNLVGVNTSMALTGIYQLSRKLRHDYFSEKEVAEVAEVAVAKE